MAEQPLPLGFGMMLAMNPTAMRNFELMTKSERESVIQKTHSVQSKDEMRRLVAELADCPDTNGVV